VVLLTVRARDMVFPGATEINAGGRPIEIIPTCVDTAKFTVGDDEARRSAKSALGLNGRRVLAHVGALDGWVATDTLAELITIALRRDPRTAVIILTKSPTDRFAQALRQRGVDPRALLVRQAAPDDVPGYLHAVDAGLAVYISSVSKAASSPTRIAEYLAAGVPALCSPHLGDVDDVVTGDRVGVVTHGWSTADLEDALVRLDALTSDPDLRTRCRATAIARFDLKTVGGARYRRLYDRVMAAPA
jgi:glycosyltransferase involved in cell wall biosynthesis